jgi:purine-nucleoside phosphorylase
MTTAKPRLLSVFLCHSSGDKPAVRQICARLRSEGFLPWLDEEEILPGARWEDAIEDAVRAADVVIVCLSPGSTTKEGFLQREIRNVMSVAEEKLDESIFVIPLKLSECEVPRRFKQWQWLNYFSDDGHSRLLMALNARARQTGAVVPSAPQPSGRSERPTSDSSGFEAATAAADFVRQRVQLRPRIGLVLGSGLGDYAGELEEAVAVDYADIPHFPSTATPVGHTRQLVVGKRCDVPIIVLQGRFHMYEGLTARDVVFPVRVLARMGVEAIVLTNASGIVNGQLPAGSLVVVSDHINLLGANALTGLNDDRFGPRFPDMSEVYSKRYRDLAVATGRDLDIPIHEGVYAVHSGPAYETPAEIRSLRNQGADLVGMSTVPEAMAARHMGLSVLAISVATAYAAGVGPTLTHTDVLEASQRVRLNFFKLLDGVLPRIAFELGDARAATST